MARIQRYSITAGPAHSFASGTTQLGCGFLETSFGCTQSPPAISPPSGGLVRKKTPPRFGHPGASSNPACHPRRPARACVTRRSQPWQNSRSRNSAFKTTRPLSRLMPTSFSARLSTAAAVELTTGLDATLKALRQAQDKAAACSAGSGTRLIAESKPKATVSKRLGSPYRSGRSPDWLKMKNTDARR
jgi:hypothetical protein